MTVTCVLHLYERVVDINIWLHETSATENILSLCWRPVTEGEYEWTENSLAQQQHGELLGHKCSVHHASTKKKRWEENARLPSFYKLLYTKR